MATNVWHALLQLIAINAIYCNSELLLIIRGIAYLALSLDDLKQNT